MQGLTRAAFADYFDYILLQLEFPPLTAKPKEQWGDHLARLRKWKNTPGAVSEYRVTFKLVNAANYGVPQKCMRVFFVGFRADEDKLWTPPTETHSADASLSQWASEEYWERHKVAARNRPPRPEGATRRSARSSTPTTAPTCWRRKPCATPLATCPIRSVTPTTCRRVVSSPARAYVGHIGSPLDEPAKALKAGDHGAPGGENLMRRTDGTLRYFNVRESARIHTFPDSFLFEGTWSDVMRQLGNAVPLRLASVIAESVCGLLRQ